MILTRPSQRLVSTRTLDAPARILVLVSPNETPCGVESFARTLAKAEPAVFGVRILDRDARDFSRRLADWDAVLINLPIVGWKRRLIEPIAAAAATRLRRKQLIVMLHEWRDLDWKRRAVVSPLLPLASSLLFSAPEIRRQFLSGRISRAAPARHALVPIPPNIARPDQRADSEARRRLANLKQRGATIVGHFGSIYPRKQSLAVLDVVARLRQRGIDAVAAFVGSFIAGSDRIEQQFWQRCQDLGITNHVVVTGYVGPAEQLFAIFDLVDVFLYLFPDGLTSRRGSVLVSAASGRPVVVNQPRDAAAFAHHPTYLGLANSGSLHFVPANPRVEHLAQAVLLASSASASVNPVDDAAAWKDAAAAIVSAVAPPKLLIASAR